MIEKSDTIDIPFKGREIFCSCTLCQSFHRTESEDDLSLKRENKEIKNRIRLRRNKVVHSWTENKLIVDSSKSSRLRIIQRSICSKIRIIQRSEIQAHSSKSRISSGETDNSLDRRARSSGWWLSWILDALSELDVAEGELSWDSISPRIGINSFSLLNSNFWLADPSTGLNLNYPIPIPQAWIRDTDTG